MQAESLVCIWCLQNLWSHIPLVFHAVNPHFKNLTPEITEHLILSALCADWLNVILRPSSQGQACNPHCAGRITEAQSAAWRWRPGASHGGQVWWLVLFTVSHRAMLPCNATKQRSVILPHLWRTKKKLRVSNILAWGQSWSLRLRSSCCETGMTPPVPDHTDGRAAAETSNTVHARFTRATAWPSALPDTSPWPLL